MESVWKPASRCMADVPQHSLRDHADHERARQLLYFPRLLAVARPDRLRLRSGTRACGATHFAYDGGTIVASREDRLTQTVAPSGQPTDGISLMQALGAVLRYRRLVVTVALAAALLM